MKKTAEVEKRVYFGYMFYEDGRIISPEGRLLQGYFFTYPYSHVNINHDGKSEKKLKAKLMYELFSGEKVSRKFIVRFRDGDPKNCAFENLYLESRKDFAKDGSVRLKKFDDKTIQEIKGKYYTKEHKKKKKAPSLRELCFLYSCSLSTIQKILE